MLHRHLSAVFATLLVLCTAPLRSAYAVGFVFDVDAATIIPGSGEAIIDKEYPLLGGKGFGAQLEAELQPTLTDLVSQLKLEVTNRLDHLDFGPFLRNTANASALSAKAAPVDHASAIRIFSLSLGGGGGLSGLGDFGTLRHPSTIDDRISNGDAPRIGVAPEASILLGVHLGKFHLPSWKYFDLNRVELYVNVMRLNLGGGSDSWAARAASYGGHAKYQVMLGRVLARHGLVRWHGLNVITGLSYSDQTVRVMTTLPASSQSQTTTYQGQRLTTTAAWTGSAHLAAQMKNFTIPIEVASSLELVWALTVYGGLAVDFNIGRASLSADAQVPIDVSVTGPRSQNDPTTVSRPLPHLAYAQMRRPAPVDGRAFFGLQVGHAPAAVFAQATADTSKSVAAHAGLRIFW